MTPYPPSHDALRGAFRRRFGTDPTWIVRAPGRVNLIGEHTDYNDGFVLPMAIDRAVWLAGRASGDRRVTVHSLDFRKREAFDLDALERGGEGWLEYLKGVAWALEGDGVALAGFSAVLTGNVPRGSGLSSSAAIELATMRAFGVVSGFAWDATRMARLAQRTENRWVGVASGIMDQLIGAAGVAGSALLIDCRSLETESVPLPGGSTVVVLDTATRRGLVGSAYNERRAQCETAARRFGVEALRDVSLAEFEANAADLDPTTRARARHVITENARTLEAAEAMRGGDAATLGRLMNASHVSLRDDFEVSSDALDAIVACAQRQPGCHGARMTGAGFGGCAVALVAEGAVDGFVEAVAACYREASGNEAEIYVCHASAGASVEWKA